jgi:predicted phage terminase large subunit-like protein
MPIAYIYDGRVYIHDVIFNKGDKKVTQPIVKGKIEHYKPHAGRFEANNGGDAYAEDISQSINVRVNITWKKAPTTQNKVSRIIQWAPDIKNFYFLDKAHRSPEYQKFFDEFVSFVQTGKNLHDDAPDSLAQLAAFIFETISTKVTFISRPF